MTICDICNEEIEEHYHSEDGGTYCEQHAPEDAFKCENPIEEVIKGVKDAFGISDLLQKAERAKADLTKLRAVKVLLSKQQFYVDLKVAGLEVPLTDHESTIMAIDATIIDLEHIVSEAKKYQNRGDE